MELITHLFLFHRLSFFKAFLGQYLLLQVVHLLRLSRVMEKNNMGISYVNKTTEGEILDTYHQIDYIYLGVNATVACYFVVFDCKVSYYYTFEMKRDLLVFVLRSILLF